MRVHVCVCVCVSAPQAIKTMKLFSFFLIILTLAINAVDERGLSNEARRVKEEKVNAVLAVPFTINAI